MPVKRAIEEDFPIVEINRLAVPERNSFKPIYQMHKWFARRASCVFRAILLGALKPAYKPDGTRTNIMEEFYKDHANDPDTNGKVVLDPFMGGGTTVVEALRLGCKVVGIDLNPVAWFIVKTEVEPVDLKELDEAFERLANRIVPWSGRPLRQTLLDLYRTAPPWTAEEVCGLPNSDVIYTFWVKSAVCTSPTCRKQVPLFTDYILAAKSPSIRFHSDCACPKCARKFEWEIEPAALVSDPRLMFHSSTSSNGKGNSRWTYAHPDGGIFVCQGEPVGGQARVRWGSLPPGNVCCPHCFEIVKPTVPVHQGKTAKKRRGIERKKVPLSVLLCPQTEDVFQWRGEIAPDACVTSPAGFTFDPHKAHVTEKGRFVCPHCGNNDAIIASIRSLPEDQLLPMHAYGLQAYAPGCAPGNDPDKGGARHSDLFGGNGEPEETEDEEATGQSDAAYSGPFVPPTHNLVWKQSGKFYERHAPADQAVYSNAEKLWQKNRDALPYPKSEIPSGQETDRLHDHHYRHWHQMFNPRQLLALSTLLDEIAGLSGDPPFEHLLTAFKVTLEANNVFTWQIASRSTPGGTAPGGIFRRHDYAPKYRICEQNVWGTVSGNNTFLNRMQMVRAGLRFAVEPTEGAFDSNDKHVQVASKDNLVGRNNKSLAAGDSRELLRPILAADVVITDPPYADNVNYAELADFFYVWLRLVLKSKYPWFLPELTPKTAEIIVNKARERSAADFQEGLTNIFSLAQEKLADDGVLVFTFHHKEGDAWESLLAALCDAGFLIEAIYPIQSEREESLHLMDNDAISYDLIHVCRKRRPEDTRAKRSWAGLRQLVRQRAREEVARIEAGRYGGQALAAADVRMVLIGKCLEVYSRHYGAVLDWNGEPFPLHSTTEGKPGALKDIRLMVEQIVSSKTPLPSELENVDALTQVWLLAELYKKREVSVDSINKDTRGVFEVSDLTGHKPPLLRKGRVKGGRTYEVLTPLERLDALRLTLRGAESSAEQLTLLTSTDNAPIVIGPELVDVIHLLAGNAEQGERLDHIVERFRGQREQIRAALQYLKQRDPDRWAKACDKLLPFYDDLFTQTAVAKEGK